MECNKYMMWFYILLVQRLRKVVANKDDSVKCTTNDAT
jgi:hypothetical protein